MQAKLLGQLGGRGVARTFGKFEVIGRGSFFVFILVMSVKIYGGCHGGKLGMVSCGCLPSY